jgi:rubrerythrin
MNHHHHHDGAEFKSALSDKEKLERLLEYWIKHNEEHVTSYLEWSKKANTWEIKDVAEILREAANTALSVNTLFQEALKKL